VVSDRLELARAAREAPDALAWIDDDGALDYRALAAEVARELDRWREAGLDPARDRVLMVPTLDRASVIALLALLELRVPIVLAHPRWSAEERAAIAARTAPAWTWVDGHLAAHRAPGSTLAHRPAVVVFTSGTSGQPKGVCLSRAALLAACEAHSGALPFADGDRWLLAMPVAHVGGLSLVLRCLHARKAVVRGPSRFELEPVMAQLERHRVTLVSVVPTMLARLVERRPPPSIRAVLVGGAACPAELSARGRAAGWPLLPTYGLSECCAQVCTQRLDDPQPTGVGPPLPGVEMRVSEGGIEVRGPTRMDGFFGEPPLPPEAWYPTGDAGRLDARGHLHVLGRLDDRIVTGGENVDPLAVEEALRAHPAVLDACVVGVDDPTWGQRVTALLVADAPLDDEALRAHLGPRLARYAWPKDVRFVQALPLTAAGKLDRQAARRLLDG
jgi:O-succinylbenzoic acid--CoA ligase